MTERRVNPDTGTIEERSNTFLDDLFGTPWSPVDFDDEDKHPTQVKMKIKDRGTILVPINRNLFEQTQVAIQINEKSRIAELPARSKFHVVSQILKSDTKSGVSTRETTGPRWGKTVCAQLGNDDQNATMIPGQKRVLWDARSKAGWVEWMEKWEPETDRGVCYAAGCNFREVWSTYCNISYGTEIGIWRAMDATKFAAELNAIQLE